MIVTVYLGLGGIFRDRIVEESWVVSAYDCHELTGTIARDFMYQKNPGAYDAGITRGIANGLPEGGIGAHFSGNQSIIIPNDGAGYLWPGDGHTRSLSLEGGGIDLVALFRTSTTDAFIRSIVQKREVTGNGNGWDMSIVNGQIRFTLVKANTILFSFARGSVADGLWHIGHCSFNRTFGAKILIDGVQSGATVANTVEPDFTTADCRIGAWNSGMPGSTTGYIGDINYVVISRNGNPDLSPALQATRAWTDVSAHVRAESVQWTGGAPGVTHRDHTAGIGTCAFVLENRPVIGGVEVPGYYTIGHANQRAGFDLNIPVMVVATSGGVSRIVHRGRLAAAKPEPGINGSTRVYCLSQDWMAVAARTDVTRAAVLTDVPSHTAWATLVDMADYPPVAVSMQTGVETFPFCFDRVDQFMLTEIAKVDQSEGGQTFIAPDATTGGVLTFQNRYHRLLTATPALTLTSQQMHGLEIQMGDERMINSVRATVTPRRVGSTNTAIVYQQTKATPIPAGTVIVIEESYQDPAQSRSAIGASEVQTPVAGTDYNMTSADGGGSNLNAFCTVEIVKGGSGFRLRVTNTGTTDGYFTFQLRGRILYTDQPISEIIEPNPALIRRHGLHRTEESYPYLDRMSTARYFGDWLVELFGLPLPVPSSVTIKPDADSAQEQTIIGLGAGNLFSLSEEMTAIDPTTAYWSSNYRMTVTNQDVLEAQFGVIPSFAAMNDTGFWDKTDSLWDDARWGP